VALTREAPRKTAGVTRRRFLGAAGSIAVAAAAASVDRLLLGSSDLVPAGLPPFGTTASAREHTFRSRPDLRPPKLEATGSAGERGHLLIGPGSEYGITQQGPMIIDNRGEPVWFRPLPPKVWATNVRAATFAGRPVITWWEGIVLPSGFGRGEGVIVDASYGEVARVQAAGGTSVDMHEFLITPQGTALFTCYPREVTTDLRAVGGPQAGKALESVIQEVDISRGRLIREWRSLDHIPITESQKPLSEPFDYLHVNSIEILPDGNLLVSGRHTWTVYKLDRQTGAVIWRLGGKRTDFGFDPDLLFSWQHDARIQHGNQLTLFDNGSDGPQTTEAHSRALVLSLDEPGRMVTAKQVLRHPQPLTASSMGSVQAMPDGNVLVGWGVEPNLTEYTADGRLVQDLRFPRKLYSYRVYRQTWSGSPGEAPALAAERRAGAAVAYVSWNGDTHTTHWELHGGHSPARLARIARAHRRGFETAIPIAGAMPRYLAVTAHDAHGRRIGASGPIRA
jgi:hypothetical protein